MNESEEIIEAMLNTLRKGIAEQSVDRSAITDMALFEIAKGINRLAATQEKPVTPTNRGKLNISVATYAETPDAQTAALRDLDPNRSEG